MSLIKNCVTISVLVFFVLLLQTIPSKAQNTKEISSSSSSKCNKEEIMNSMKITGDKCKDFINKGIKGRLNIVQKSTGGEENKKLCLRICLESYAKAGEAIARGSIEASNGKNVEAAKEVMKYCDSTVPCSMCSYKTFGNDQEFMHFQDLAKLSGDDLLKTFQNCQTSTF